MVRIGLTLYLMLATVAGPWLCCCTAGDFPAPLSRKPSAPSAPRPCCGHEKSPSGHSALDEEQAPGRPVPAAPHGPCPCKEGRQSLSAAVPPEASPGGESGGPMAGLYPFEAGAFLVSWSTDPGDKGVGSGEPTTFPFSSCRDILRALHVLRC